MNIMFLLYGSTYCSSPIHYAAFFEALQYQRIFLDSSSLHFDLFLYKLFKIYLRTKNSNSFKIPSYETKLLVVKTRKYPSTMQIKYAGNNA